MNQCTVKTTLEDLRPLQRSSSISDHIKGPLHQDSRSSTCARKLENSCSRIFDVNSCSSEKLSCENNILSNEKDQKLTSQRPNDESIKTPRQKKGIPFMSTTPSNKIVSSTNIQLAVHLKPQDFKATASKFFKRANPSFTQGIHLK